MAKTNLNQEQQITLAQFQVIEAAYSYNKMNLDYCKNDVRKSKAQYDKLAGEVEDLIAEIEEEENDANRQALRVELAKKKKELEELENETKVKQATKAQVKTLINQSIEQIKELPGVGQAIQEIMARRYDKEIKSIEKEQKQGIEDKESLGRITELVDEDKTENAQEISDSFKDMLDARNEIKKAEAKIAEIDGKLTTEKDPTVRTDLNQQKADMTAARTNAQTKYQTARAKFMTLSKGADVEFEEKEVDNIVAVVNDNMKRRKGRENDYSLEKVLSKQMAATDKNILSLEAQKAEYEQGKAAIGQERAQEEGTPQDKIEQAIEQKEQALQEEEKLHWWNFIKKHKRKKEIEQYKKELEEKEQEEQQPDNDKAHKAFVRELQKNSTIDAIVNREMRETRDRVADIKRSHEERDEK